MKQLFTRWGRELKNHPERAQQGDVLRDYPRPQLVRDNWVCLNGYWDYAITKNPLMAQEKDKAGDKIPDKPSDCSPDKTSADQPASDKHLCRRNDTLSDHEEKKIQSESRLISELGKQDPAAMLSLCPAQWDGRILVPFAPESALSGVGRQLQPEEFLWYHRTFTLDSSWSTMERAKIRPAIDGSEEVHSRMQALLLHFGAVDQTCMVFVNGSCAAVHVGGYLSFTADITALVRDGGNELLVLVQDLSDASFHARGKQTLQRGGMFYTATSGIWQTVWLETVPRHYIERLEIRPDSDTGAVHFVVRTKSSHWEDNTILPVTIAIRRAERYDKTIFARRTDDHAADVAAETSVCKDKDTGTDIDNIDISTDIGTGTDTGMGTGTDTGTDKGVSPASAGPAEASSPKEKEGTRPPIIAAATGFADTEVTVRIPRSQIHHWSPEEPWLYSVDVILENAGAPDHVKSYLALRSFTLERDRKGILRVCLNHEPCFQKGVLDQGYWPDGLLTPPSEEAVVFDIAEAKKTGFNMIRKHIKVEPDRWYYHCDRLGMMVWQDMVNGGEPLKQWFVTYMATGISLLQLTVPDTWHRLLSRENVEGRREFEQDLRGEIAQLQNHPCICTWVIFNEGWGQFDTNQLTALVRELDPDRLIDQASGWFDQHGGDFRSVHNYFFPFRVHREKKRAYVLSEFGGKTLRVEGHCAQEAQDGQYGYGTTQDAAALQKAFEELDQKVMAMEDGGLCGSVYTQWTDIEDEINGVYTYDREVRKIE